MKIELSILKDGGVLLVCDNTMPDILKRIEFYRDQRLMMLVYQNKELDGDLFEYEVPESMLHPVESSPDIMVFVMFPDHDPVGYKVPLIKVGDLY